MCVQGTGPGDERRTRSSLMPNSVSVWDRTHDNSASETPPTLDGWLHMAALTAQRPPGRGAPTSRPKPDAASHSQTYTTQPRSTHTEHGLHRTADATRQQGQARSARPGPTPSSPRAHAAAGAKRPQQATPQPRATDAFIVALNTGKDCALAVAPPFTHVFVGGLHPKLNAAGLLRAFKQHFPGAQSAQARNRCIP